MQRVIFCEPIKTGVKLPFWNAVIQMLYVLKLTHSLLMRPAWCHLHTSVQLFYWMSPLDRTLPPRSHLSSRCWCFCMETDGGGGGHTMASWQSEEFASGGRHQVLFIPWHAIRKLKVILCRLGESTLSRRRITCHWKEKKHFDRCVIVVPPRAYFMLTRIALALKMYCVSCCRWQIHFTYRASLCHPSASFYVEAWRRPLRSHEVLLIQQLLSPRMISTPGSKNVLMGERERRYYWRPT